MYLCTTFKPVKIPIEQSHPSVFLETVRNAGDIANEIVLSVGVFMLSLFNKRKTFAC